MKKFFINKEAIQNKTITLIDDEFYHLKTVLRSKENENVICLDGSELIYNCVISQIAKNYATLEIISTEQCLSNPKINITIFQGLPKGDKLDLIAQKATELGISTIIPFESNFTIAKNNSIKIERLNKIVKEACKQCGRSKPLQIENTISFKKIPETLNNFDLILLLYEHQNGNYINSYIEKIQKSKNIAIIIGAEGGFSNQEVELLVSNGANCVSLGNRILRTETATIGLASFISFLTNN